MNYFIAINCSEVSNYLKTLQYEIEVPNKVNYAQNFHLTLKFLGKIDDEQTINMIKKRLETFSFDKEFKKINNNKKNNSELNITLSHIGEFVVGEQRRIVWVGIKEKELLKSIQEKVDNLLYPILEKDKRFFPHITLLRIKNNNKSLFNWNLFEQRIKSKYVNTQFIDERIMKVNKIELLKSSYNNKTKETKYEALAKYYLNEN
jgi:2'-5' RNA ligase